jgi:hypothetical protein
MKLYSFYIILFLFISCNDNSTNNSDSSFQYLLRIKYLIPNPNGSDDSAEVFVIINLSKPVCNQTGWLKHFESDIYNEI